MFGKTAPRLTKRWQAGLPDHVIAIGQSSDGKHVAAAAVTGPIAIFDADSGKTRYELAGHSFGTAAVAWRPDSALLASAGQDGRIRLWDCVTGQESAALAGGGAWVEKLAWSESGAYLASGAGKKVRLWDPAGVLLREYPALGSTVADLCWRPGAHDLTALAYGGVTVFIPESTSPKRVLDKKVSLLAAAWSPDSKFLAAGAQDATVYFWIWKSGLDLQMAGYPTKVRELAWDRTSRYLATGGSSWVLVWDCSGKGPEGSKPIMLEAHADDKLVTALAYQKQGDYLASGGSDGLIALWQPGAAKRPLAQVRLDAGVTALCWSANERQLLAGTAGGTVFAYSI